MRTEDITDCMKEMIRCYEECNNFSFSSKEIGMWRKHFLSCFPENDEKFNCYITNIFMSMPTEDFLERTPEENLLMIRNYYANKSP